MKLSDFLLSEKAVSAPSGKRERYAGKDLNEICQLWRKQYRTEVGEEYLITPKEKMLMRKLVEEYGVEKVKTAILYYTENFRELKKPDGYPSIPALYGFRRQLVVEAVKGTVPAKKSFPGQYNPANMGDDDWG